MIGKIGWVKTMADWDDEIEVESTIQVGVEIGEDHRPYYTFEHDELVKFINDIIDGTEEWGSEDYNDSSEMAEKIVDRLLRDSYEGRHLEKKRCEMN